MKTIKLLILLLLAPLLASAQVPTNNIAPTVKALSVTTNNALTGGDTNFFAVNSNLLNNAVSGANGGATNGIQQLNGYGTNTTITNLTANGGSFNGNGAGLTNLPLSAMPNLNTNLFVNTNDTRATVFTNGGMTLTIDGPSGPVVLSNAVTGASWMLTTNASEIVNGRDFHFGINQTNTSNTNTFGAGDGQTLATNNHSAAIGPNDWLSNTVSSVAVGVGLTLSGTTNVTSIGSTNASMTFSNASGTVTLVGELFGNGGGLTNLNIGNVGLATNAISALGSTNGTFGVTNPTGGIVSIKLQATTGGGLVSVLTSTGGSLFITNSVSPLMKFILSTNGIGGNAGSGLTNIQGSNVVGTIADAQLTSDVVLTNGGAQTIYNNDTFQNALTVAGSLTVAGTGPSTLNISNGLAGFDGTNWYGAGSGLSNLNASGISSGTVADARLTSDVVLTNGGSQTIYNSDTFQNAFTASGSVTFNGLANTPSAGSIVTFTGSGGGINASNSINISGSDTAASYTATGAAGFSGSGLNLSNLTLFSFTNGPAAASAVTNYTVSFGGTLDNYLQAAAGNVCFNNFNGTQGPVRYYIGGTNSALWPTNCDTLVTNGLTLSGTNWLLPGTNGIRVSFYVLTNFANNASLTNVFVDWLGYAAPSYSGNGGGLTNLYGGTAPTITTNASGLLGIGGVAALTTGTGGINTDTAFKVKVSTGTGATYGQMFHVAYSSTKTVAPIPIFSCASLNSSQTAFTNDGFYTTNETTSGFDFYDGIQNLGAETNMVFNFFCPHQQ